MSRKRTKKNPKDEVNAMKKILCDEAQNQMKVKKMLESKLLKLKLKNVLEGSKFHEGSFWI